MITRLKNGKIITDSVLEGYYLYMNEGKITDITREELPFDSEIDVNGDYVSPGFIDIHTHGGGGYDFMDGGAEAVINGAKAHVEYGTTSIMITTLTVTPEVLNSSLKDIGEAMKCKDEDMPHIIGAHLEGPYFSLKQCGAQDPRYITPPVKKDYEEAMKIGKGIIKRWSFAPELEGAPEFCAALVENDIVPSIAHTDGEYKDIMASYEQGCKLMTHFYSGMSGLVRRKSFRILGAIETGYLIDDMDVEAIADGRHLPAELLRLIYKVKGADHICLVTDSTRGAGMKDAKEIILGPKHNGVQAIIEDEVAKTPDRESFAGSIATADRLVRTMHKEAGVNIVDCVKMITQNPARIMKLEKTGKLEKGYDADVITFNENIEISNVWISGRKVK